MERVEAERTNTGRTLKLGRNQPKEKRDLFKDCKVVTSFFGSQDLGVFSKTEECLGYYYSQGNTVSTDNT